ncbi:MAG: RNA polymerase ECF subfamily sigma 70 factor [Oceanicaulis sp. HLUCCA04]|nr:MAG: RNA polymerase ECF subfamily sigma 70 factor [Oceanicaulis sp. HLUCCA04]
MNNHADPSYRAAEQAARNGYGKLVAILAAHDQDIAAAEDALGEALVAALNAWPVQGVPQSPEAWLVTVARNRLKNAARSRAVRLLAEPELMRRAMPDPETSDFPDRRLQLMLACAHPAIDAAARAPLILQVILGIDAARIARAFLTEPSAMSQRLVRAKARIRDVGLRYELPGPEDMPERLAAVLDAIYAAFGDGYDRLEMPGAHGALTGEAIWLARLIVEMLPDEPEAKGLLALMLYCAARRAARRDQEGRFVPLAEQNPKLWDRTMVIEAEGLLIAAARAGRFGRYQCEAAIQSVHVQRAATGQLNLQALRTLYDLLVTRTDSIGARIGRAVVMADAGDPDAALADLEAIDRQRIAAHQPWWVARAHCARLAGRGPQAAGFLRQAIALTDDDAIRAYLAGSLDEAGPDTPDMRGPVTG